MSLRLLERGAIVAEDFDAPPLEDTRWRVQLDVRNVLNRDGLLVQRVLTTGEGAVYTVQEPRSFILTNTFSF